MIKSSNKKHFKKDIHILKIQGNSKYCKQHGDLNCGDYYIFGPICTYKNFTKHLFKKRRISCHNLFFLGKRGATRYLALQEDHNVSIFGLFYILGQCAQIRKSVLRSPKKVKFQVCFYQSLTDNMAFLKWSHCALEG